MRELRTLRLTCRSGRIKDDGGVLGRGRMGLVDWIRERHPPDRVLGLAGNGKKNLCAERPRTLAPGRFEEWMDDQHSRARVLRPTNGRTTMATSARTLPTVSGFQNVADVAPTIGFWTASLR